MNPENKAASLIDLVLIEFRAKPIDAVNVRPKKAEAKFEFPRVKVIPGGW